MRWYDCGLSAAVLSSQEARVQRATIIQNYATSMANIKELSAAFKQFWEHQPGGDDMPQRFKELQVRSTTMCRTHVSAAGGMDQAHTHALGKQPLANL